MKIKELILNILKNDDRLWSDENELNQTLLFDLVENLDEKIIELLFSDEMTKRKFFKPIKDVYVFDGRSFRFFLEENKINNSYTIYKNRIGLSDGKKFLKDSADVVLDFPFKDCVLEGGQSDEEGMDTYFEYDEKVSETEAKKGLKQGTYNQKQSKRKEIFFNQTLAQDEIDRLFDEKALTNFKRFNGGGGGKIPTNLKRDENGVLRENLIIKGNNLLALHSIKSEFAGKVKLIYIDPPYNPDSSANTFAYNNHFNHSTWLAFMKNRVDIAKKFLCDNGFFCVAIDHYEIFYIGVLLDEIFGRINRVAIVAVETNPGGRSDSAFFATSHEYFIVYAKDISKAKINDLMLNQDELKKYNLNDDISNYKLVPLKRTGSNSTPDKRPNLMFPIFYSTKNNSISLEKQQNDIEIMPIGSDKIMRVWRWSKSKILNNLENLEVKKSKDGYSVFVKDRIKFGKKPKTMWYDSKYDASSHGTKLLKKMNLDKLFSYPKPIYLLKDILQVLINKNDIILDYHAGSGTTGHAVLELNKEDGGNRKFILIEQMDYIENVTCKRVQNVMKKDNIDDSFIYFELAKYNEKAKEKILASKDFKELKTFFSELYEKYFLNYNLKQKDFIEKTINEDEFQALSLEEQKKIFIAMLDNNQMYINFSEIKDEKFGVDNEDIKMSEEFYKKGK